MIVFICFIADEPEDDECENNWDFWEERLADEAECIADVID